MEEFMRLEFGRWLARAVVALSAVVLVGCAARGTQPMPVLQKSVAIRVDATLTKGGAPGVYAVPDSQVIVACQPDHMPAVLWFGVPGAMVVSEVNKAASADLVRSSENVLRLKIDRQVAEAMARSVTDRQLGSRFTFDASQDGPTLLIQPIVNLCVRSDTDVLPFVMMRVWLLERDTPLWPGQGRKSLWATGYYSSSGPGRPLTGPGGWAEDNASALKAVVQQNIERLADAMLTDMARPAIRDDRALISVAGPYPFTRNSIRTIGYQLADQPDYIVYAPKVAGGGYFGIYLMDKSMSSIRPARRGESDLAAEPVEGK
jgi:hypothetical protein